MAWAIAMPDDEWQLTFLYRLDLAKICQAPDVLRGAADEVLAAIKTEGVLDSERKKDRRSFEK